MSTIVITSPLRSTLPHFSGQKSPNSVQAKTTTSGFMPNINLGLKKANQSENSKSFSTLAALLDVKHRRRVVENNARLLANRLIVLSLEEKKMRSHTQGIQKRAQDLLFHRVGREQKKQEKAASIGLFRGNQEKSLDEVRLAHMESKTQYMFHIKKIQDSMYEEVRKNVAERKEQSIKNMELIYQSRRQKVNQMRATYQKLKQEETVIPEKVKKAKQDRLEIIKQKKARIITDEFGKIAKRQNEIKKLDRKEDVLLENLHKAEREEAEALEEYNEISYLPLDKLMKKYNHYAFMDSPGKSKSTFSPNKTELSIVKSF